MPAPVWLAVVVAVSALVRFGLSRDSPAPWIFVDELIYSELAKSLAAGGDLLVRDAPTGGYGVVYPLLISPAWALFDSVPDAYVAAKAINALLISLAALPAYALARRLVGEGLALAAAVLAVALPSLAYSGTIMTENVFYPLFLSAVLALTLVLERPTLVRQIVLVALLGLAFLSRPQAVALVAAALTAPVVQGLLARRVRAAVAAQRTLYAIAATGLLLVLGGQLVRGQPLSSLLGAYAVVGEGGYRTGAVARYLLYHVAELDLYVGVAPFAAALLLAVCARGQESRVDAFLAAAIASSVWLLLVVSTFASRFSDRVLERNVFYLVPLVLVALLAWIERGAPRPARAAAVAAVVAAALPGTLPFARLIHDQSIADTLMLLPLARLQEHGLDLAELSAVVVPASAGAAAVLLLLPRRWMRVLPLLVLAWFLVALVAVEGRFAQVSRGALDSGISSPDLDWVDRAVPAGSEVSFLWTGEGDVYHLWQNEFFNRSVRTVLSVDGAPLPGGLPKTDLETDEQAGLLRARDGEPVRPRFVLADDTFTPAGRVVARDVGQGMTLYELGGPLRSTTKVTGLYGDTWSGAEVTYTRHDCRGGVLAVSLRSDPSLFTEPQTVVARVEGEVVGRVTFEPSEEKQLLVPLTPGGDRSCLVEFTVSPTAVPAELTLGANPDTRVLGVHFDAFDYLQP